MITIQRSVVLALVAVLMLAACGSSDGRSASAFCDQVKAFRSKYVKSVDDLTQKQIDDASVELAAMAKSAPKAIRSDVESVSDAFDLYTAGKDPPLYRAKEFQTASTNLTVYTEQHCGIDISTPTT